MFTCYVSGKYSSKKTGKDAEVEVEQNILNAESYAIELGMLGFGVFCPHLNFDGFDGILSYKDLMIACFKFVELTDTMFMVPGWEDSSGASREWRNAKALERPIFYNIDEAREWLKTGWRAR